MKEKKKPRQVLEVDGEGGTTREGLGRERKVRLGRISWNHLAVLGQGVTVVTLKYNLPKSRKKTPRESEPISHISCPD